MTWFCLIPKLRILEFRNIAQIQFGVVSFQTAGLHHCTCHHVWITVRCRPTVLEVALKQFSSDIRTFFRNPPVNQIWGRRRETRQRPDYEWEYHKVQTKTLVVPDTSVCSLLYSCRHLPSNHIHYLHIYQQKLDGEFEHSLLGRQPRRKTRQPFLSDLLQ